MVIRNVNISVVTFGVGIVDENVEAVDEVCSVEGVASDADAEGLAQAHGRRLVDSLVGQGAGPRHDADAALLVDVAGHDANLALREMKILGHYLLS